jgi:tetratricopeptide (TPR) repeat protein
MIDLEESILYTQQAVQLTDNGHLDRPMYLSNLSNSQRIRFDSLAKPSDLEDSISNLQYAIQYTNDINPKKPGYLSNLGASKRVRFQHLGHVSDLDDSISYLHKAVQLAHDGDPNKPMYLGILATNQGVRFDRLQKMSDLEASISNIQQAIQLTDDLYPNRAACLSSLGNSQLLRFMLLREPANLEDSISNLQKAVWLTDDGHPDKAKVLSNLGVGQRRRFEHFGALADLESSIENQQRAIKLADDGNLRKPDFLFNLGGTLESRFGYLGEMTDLDNSISIFQEAVHLTDNEHPANVKCLLGVGFMHELRFERLNDPADLIASVSAFQAAAQSKIVYPRLTFTAARKWAEISHRTNHLSSALDGYCAALELFPKVAWLGLEASYRQNWLFEEDFESLCSLSAACAIQLGRFEQAVELLDLGRSVFWQEASSLRGDVETLRAEHPELAEELESVGRKLDADDFSSSFPTIENYVASDHRSKPDVAMQRRRLVEVWEGLVEKVRQIPQFQYFLRPIPFHQLCQAATGGEVVLINVSIYGIDALILRAASPIKHVSLSNNIDVETLEEMCRNVIHQRPMNSSESQRLRYTKRYLKPALRTVWNDMVVLIFDAIQIPLKRNDAPPERRIWWYLTGPLAFIPIHAAGPGGGHADVSHLVVSSYVTSLCSLLQMQKKKSDCITGRQKLLIISQPQTPGETPLPQCTSEILRVVQVARSMDWSEEDMICLIGSDATVDRVSSALDTCSWIHFACHGNQHPTWGMKSGFSLHDSNLTLAQIASKRLSKGQFAFLSVCHAAAGLHNLPGEAMHLAGGLQFAGFPSVIATMWAISDGDAPRVAGDSYDYLFRNGPQNCDYSEAATALNHAVLHLREDPQVTLDRWAPFVHFGI